MAQANDPYKETDEYIEEGSKKNGQTVGKVCERIEKDAVRKVIGKVLYQPHMIIGIFILKPDPGAGENVMIGEIDAQEQGKAKDDDKCCAVHNAR